MRYLIQNATIVIGDGRTAPWQGDVLLEAGQIVHLGSVPESALRSVDRTIEAAGLVLAPGFVDTHNHGALGGTKITKSGVPLACEMALMGGITKRICGVDGLSPAPVAPSQWVEYAEQLRPLDGEIDSPWSWSTVPEFYEWHEGRSVTDLGLYLGHSAVRRVVMGNVALKADHSDLSAMQAVVRREAPHTLGFSTGLVYNPAAYSDQSELTALLSAYQEIAPAALFPHLRSESDLILESLHECLTACVDSGARYCNEHSKIAGRENYGKITALEDKLADASASISMMANMYPYTAGSTTGDALFPPELRAGSRQDFLGRLQDPTVRQHTYERICHDTKTWDNFIAFCGGLEGIQIAGAADPGAFLGKRLGDIARSKGFSDLESRGAYEAVFDFFVENALDVTIISHYGSELIMERLFRRPDMAICTDGLMPGPGQKPHPRTIGSFPKALRMARELGIPLEQIIWRLSGLPCAFLGLESPILREGGDASVVLFDPKTVSEQGDYQDPMVRPVGIHKVWVHGVLALDEGQFVCGTNRPGRILRRLSPDSLPLDAPEIG